jgi:hypothetical protein
MDESVCRQYNHIIYVFHTINLRTSDISNEFVFSTSNVSSDNASFINLSVLGDATIVTLSTTNFSPTTLDAQVLTATNGTITTFQSTSSYISNLSVSSMSVDNLSVDEVDITLLDVETLEVDTLKIMDTVNSNYSQVVRASDVMTIAGGYVDPLDPSVTYRGRNQSNEWSAWWEPSHQYQSRQSQH